MIFINVAELLGLQEPAPKPKRIKIPVKVIESDEPNYLAKPVKDKKGWHLAPF